MFFFNCVKANGYWKLTSACVYLGEIYSITLRFFLLKQADKLLKAIKQHYRQEKDKEEEVQVI